jgi:hypothetical protein
MSSMFGEPAMRLRSGSVLVPSAPKTKGFNVKSRAAVPRLTNVIVSADEAVLKLATSYAINAQQAENGYPSVLANQRYYETRLDNWLSRGILERHDEPPDKEAEKAELENVKGMSASEQTEYLVKMANYFKPGKYLLIGFGTPPHDYLYFSQSPLDLRGGRANPAKPKKDPNLADAPDSDEVLVTATWTGPATRGKETPDRIAVMGETALRYVEQVFDPEWANERKWEWLHVRAASLGGDHVVGNLVAGTFDANTQMIPFETEIARLTNQPQALPVSAEWAVTLYPDTRVAIGIQMSYKSNMKSGSGWIPTTTNLVFDKLQYDLWRL